MFGIVISFNFCLFCIPILLQLHVMMDGLLVGYGFRNNIIHQFNSILNTFCLWMLLGKKLFMPTSCVVKDWKLFFL